jgi:hypothetical protein
MNAADEPSKRLVQQRMRNRAIEALETLADGEEGVRAAGVVEYVEEFFDVIDDRAPWHWKEWSTFTPEEVIAIDRVQQLMLEACAGDTRRPGNGGVHQQRVADTHPAARNGSCCPHARTGTLSRGRRRGSAVAPRIYMIRNMRGTATAQSIRDTGLGARSET